jgi:hypothetical protein
VLAGDSEIRDFPAVIEYKITDVYKTSVFRASVLAKAPEYLAAIATDDPWNSRTDIRYRSEHSSIFQSTYELIL